MLTQIQRTGMTKKARPTFRHYCPHCVFLTNYRKIDLYYCKHEDSGNRYVIRYGNSEANYLSGDGQDSFFPELQKAKFEADKRGFA